MTNTWERKYMAETVLSKQPQWKRTPNEAEEEENRRILLEALGGEEAAKEQLQGLKEYGVKRFTEAYDRNFAGVKTAIEEWEPPVDWAEVSDWSSMGFAVSQQASRAERENKASGWRKLVADTFEFAPVKYLMEGLSVPLSFVASTVQSTIDVFSGDWESALKWGDRIADGYTFGQILHEQNWLQGDAWYEVWGARAIGFTGDVLLDPLTYLGFVGKARHLSLLGKPNVLVKTGLQKTIIDALPETTKFYARGGLASFGGQLGGEADKLKLLVDDIAEGKISRTKTFASKTDDGDWVIDVSAMAGVVDDAVPYTVTLSKGYVDEAADMINNIGEAFIQRGASGMSTEQVRGWSNWMYKHGIDDAGKLATDFSDAAMPLNKNYRGALYKTQIEADSAAVQFGFKGMHRTLKLVGKFGLGKMDNSFGRLITRAQEGRNLDLRGLRINASTPVVGRAITGIPQAVRKVAYGGARGVGRSTRGLIDILSKGGSNKELRAFARTAPSATMRRNARFALHAMSRGRHMGKQIDQELRNTARPFIEAVESATISKADAKRLAPDLMENIESSSKFGNLATQNLSAEEVSKVVYHALGGDESAQAVLRNAVGEDGALDLYEQGRGVLETVRVQAQQRAGSPFLGRVSNYVPRILGHDAREYLRANKWLGGGRGKKVKGFSPETQLGGATPHERSRNYISTREYEEQVSKLADEYMTGAKAGEKMSRADAIAAAQTDMAAKGVDGEFFGHKLLDPNEAIPEDHVLALATDANIKKAGSIEMQIAQIMDIEGISYSLFDDDIRHSLSAYIETVSKRAGTVFAENLLKQEGVMVDQIASLTKFPSRQIQSVASQLNITFRSVMESQSQIIKLVNNAEKLDLMDFQKGLTDDQKQFLDDLGLGQTATPEDVAAQIDIIKEEMLAHKKIVDHGDERINKLQKTVNQAIEEQKKFEDEAIEVVRRIQEVDEQIASFTSEMKLVNPDDAKGLIEAAKKLDDMEKLRVFLLTENDTGLKYVSGTINNMADQTLFDLKVKQTIAGVLVDEDNFNALHRAFANYRSANFVSETLGDFMARSKDAAFTQSETGAWQFTHVKPDGSTLVMNETQLEMAFTQLTAFTNKISDMAVGGWVSTSLVIADDGIINLNALNQLKAIMDESAFQITQGEIMVKRINEIMGTDSPFQKLGIGTKKKLPTPKNVQQAQDDMQRIVAQERAKHSTDKELMEALNQNEEYQIAATTFFDVHGSGLTRPQGMSAKEVESFVKQMEEPLHNMIVGLREDIAVKQPIVTVVDANGRTRDLGVRDYLYYKGISVETNPHNSFGPPVGSSPLPIRVNGIGEDVNDILARGEVIAIHRPPPDNFRYGDSLKTRAHPATDILGENHEDLVYRNSKDHFNDPAGGNHLTMKVRVTQEDGSHIDYAVKVFDWNDSTELNPLEDVFYRSPQLDAGRGVIEYRDLPDTVPTANVPRLVAQTQSIGDNIANDLNILSGKSSQRAPRTRVGQITEESAAMVKGTTGNTITSHNLLGKHVVVSRWMDNMVGDLYVGTAVTTQMATAADEMMILKVDDVFIRKGKGELLSQGRVDVGGTVTLPNGKVAQVVGTEAQLVADDVVFNAFFARGIKAGPSTAEGAFPLEKYKLNHETGELVYKGGSKSGMFGVRADATGSYVGEYTTQINDVFLSYIVNDPQKYTEALLQFEKILQLELAAGGWEKYVAKLLGPNASEADIALHANWLKNRTDEMIERFNYWGEVIDPNHVPIKRLTTVEGLEKMLAEQGLSFQQIDELTTLPAKTTQTSSQTNKLTKGRKPWLSPDGSSQAATSVSVGGGVKIAKGMDEKILRTARANHTQIESELIHAKPVNSVNDWGGRSPYEPQISSVPEDANMWEFVEGAKPEVPPSPQQMEEMAAKRVAEKIKNEQFLEISPSAAKLDYPDLYKAELDEITRQQMGQQMGEVAGISARTAVYKPDMGWEGLPTKVGTEEGQIDEIMEAIAYAGGTATKETPTGGLSYQGVRAEYTPEEISGKITRKRAQELKDRTIDPEVFDWFTEGVALFDERTLLAIKRGGVEGEDMLRAKVADVVSGRYAKERLSSGIITPQTYRSIAEMEFHFSATYVNEFFDKKAGAFKGSADIAGAEKIKQDWINARIDELMQLEPPREPIFVQPNSTVKVVIYDRDGNVVMRMPVDEVGSTKNANFELISANVGDQDPVAALKQAAYDQTGQKIEVVSWMDDPKLVEQGEQVFVAKLVHDPQNPKVGEGINYDPQFQDRVLRFNHVLGGLSFQDPKWQNFQMIDFLNFSYHQSPQWFDQNSLNAVLFNHMYQLPQGNIYTGGLLVDAQGKSLKIYGVLPENQEKVDILLREITEGNLSSEELASVYERLNSALFNPANSSYGRGSVQNSNIPATQMKLDMIAQTLDPFGAAGDDIYNRIRYEAARAVDGISINTKGQVEIDPQMQRIINRLQLDPVSSTGTAWQTKQTVRGRKFPRSERGADDSLRRDMMMKTYHKSGVKGVDQHSKEAGARAIARAFTQAKVNRLSEVLVTTMKRLDNIGSRQWNDLSMEQKILFMGFLDDASRQSDTLVGDWLPDNFRWYDTQSSAITVHDRALQIQKAENAYMSMRSMAPEDLDAYVTRFLSNVTPTKGGPDGAEAWARLYGRYMNSPVMRSLIGKQNHAQQGVDTTLKLAFGDEELAGLPLVVRESLEGPYVQLKSKGFFEYVGDGWKNANRLDANTAGYKLSPKELRSKIVDLFDPTKAEVKQRLESLQNLRKLIEEDPNLVTQHEEMITHAQEVIEEMSFVFEAIRAHKFKFRLDAPSTGDQIEDIARNLQQGKYGRKWISANAIDNRYAVPMPREIEDTLWEMSNMYDGLIDSIPEDIIKKAGLEKRLFPEEFDDLLNASAENTRHMVEAPIYQQKPAVEPVTSDDIDDLLQVINNSFERGYLGDFVPPNHDPLGDIPLGKSVMADRRMEPNLKRFFNADGSLKDNIDFEELVDEMAYDADFLKETKELMAYYTDDAIYKRGSQRYDFDAIDDRDAAWFNAILHTLHLDSNILNTTQNIMHKVLKETLTNPLIAPTLTRDKLKLVHTLAINHVARFGQHWEWDLLRLVEDNFRNTLKIAEKETVGIISAKSDQVRSFFDDMEDVLTKTGSLSGDFEKTHRQGFDAIREFGGRLGQELGLVPPTRTMKGATAVGDPVFASPTQMGTIRGDVGIFSVAPQTIITDPAQLAGTRGSTELLATDIWDNWRTALASEGYSATAWQNWEHATGFPTASMWDEGIEGVPRTQRQSANLAQQGGVRAGVPTNVNVMITNPAMIAKDRTAFIAQQVSDNQTVLKQTKGTVGTGTVDNYASKQVVQEYGPPRPTDDMKKLAPQEPFIQGGGRKVDALPIRHFMEEYEKLLKIDGSQSFAGDEKVADVIAEGGDRAEAVIEMLSLYNMYMEKAKLIKMSDTYIPTRKMMAENRVEDLQKSLRELIGFNEKNMAVLKPYQELTQRANAVLSKSEQARVALDDLKKAMKAGEITQPEAEQLMIDLERALDVLDDANFSDIDRQVKETILKGKEQASSIGAMHQEIVDPFKGVQQLTIDDVLEQSDAIVIPLGKKNHKKHANAFDKTFRSGMKAFGTGLSGPEGLVDAMTAVTKYEMNGGGRGWVRYYDKLHNLMKGYMIAKPSFHLRNFYSGAFMNYLAGVSVGSYRRFQNAYWADNLAFAKEQGWDDVVAKIEKQVKRRVQVTTASAEDIAIVRQMRDQGLLGKNMTQTGMEFEATNITLGGKKIGLKKAATQINPFNPNNAFLRLSKNAGVGTEAFLRGTLSFDTMVKGGSVEEAFDLVTKYHFDYDDLSAFERKVIKRVFPFYVWTKRAMPLMLEEIFRNPKKMARFEHFKSELGGYGEDSDVPVPDYFRRLGGVSLPIKYEGQNMWWLPDFPQKAPMELLDPMADSVAKLVTGKGSVQDTIGQALSTIMPMTSPLIKAPIELGANKNFWHGYNFNGSYQQVPTVYKNVPFLMPAMDYLGLAEKRDDGGYIMKDSSLNFMATLLPTLSDMRRLFPSEERYQQRTLSTWLSFVFGLGLRTNTLWEQENVLKNEHWQRIQELEDERRKQRSLNEPTD